MPFVIMFRIVIICVLTLLSSNPLFGQCELYQEKIEELKAVLLDAKKIAKKVSNQNEEDKAVRHIKQLKVRINDNLTLLEEGKQIADSCDCHQGKTALSNIEKQLRNAQNMATQGQLTQGLDDIQDFALHAQENVNDVLRVIPEVKIVCK
jgi:uncharacterized membrane protein YgaE (UPF0421/DUF939 family)